MNLRCKIGSAIPTSSRLYSDFGTKRNVRSVDGSVYPEITNMVNTNTGELLKTTQHILKTNNTKRGNPGKIVRLNLSTVQFRISSTSRDPVLQLYHCSFENVVIINLFGSKMLHPELYRVYGGKIREKANALSNYKDIVNNKFLHYLKWPRVIHIGQKLNSLCLRKNPLNRSYHSTAPDESSKLIKRQLVEEITSK